MGKLRASLAVFKRFNGGGGFTIIQKVKWESITIGAPCVISQKVLWPPENFESWLYGAAHGQGCREELLLQRGGGGV